MVKKKLPCVKEFQVNSMYLREELAYARMSENKLNMKALSQHMVDFF